MATSEGSRFLRLLRAGRDDDLGVGPVRDRDRCTHARLMGRFRGPRELERGEAMGYKCQLCYREFLPADPEVTRSRTGAPTKFEPTPQDGALPD